VEYNSTTLDRLGVGQVARLPILNSPAIRSDPNSVLGTWELCAAPTCWRGLGTGRTRYKSTLRSYVGNAVAAAEVEQRATSEVVT
jgi:hypothetical protein